MTHPVTLVVQSMREHPEDWRVTNYRAEHKNNFLAVWLANGVYGMKIEGCGASYGGLTLLSFLYLSWGHWRLWFACRKLSRDRLAKILEERA